MTYAALAATPACNGAEHRELKNGATEMVAPL